MVHKHLPPVGDAAAAAEVVAIAKGINGVMKGIQGACGANVAASVDELDEDAIKKYALYCAAELQPVCAFFGGIAAQEIVKVCSKFQPMNQWLHFDCFEILPEEVATDTAVTGSRYDHQISVFGRAFQEKLAVCDCGKCTCIELRIGAISRASHCCGDGRGCNVVWLPC